MRPRPTMVRMTTRGWAAVIATSLLGTSLARAQPVEPSQAPMQTMEAPISPAPDVHAKTPLVVEKRVRGDANARRGWLAPTALADPGGTWWISDQELLLLSIGYAVNDRLSVGVTTIPLVARNAPVWSLFHTKLQVHRSGRVRAAVQGGVTYLSLGGDIGGTLVTGEIGAALTVCLDDDCHSHLSAFLGAGSIGNNRLFPVIGAGTLVARLREHIKLVIEVDSGFVVGHINAIAKGAVLLYGLRFTSRTIGVDLGFLQSTAYIDSSLGFGFPIVSVSYRNID